MKRFRYSCLILLAVVLAASLFLFAPRGEAFENEVNLAALRRAIEFMQAHFGVEYPKGDAYLQRLLDFETQLGALNAAAENMDDHAPKNQVLLDELRVFQRQVLLDNPYLDFSQIVAVERSERNLGLPQNWQGNCSLSPNRFDNEIALWSLSPGENMPLQKTATVYRPDTDVFAGDLCLHWDAQRLLFSSLNDAKQWHVYEVGLDGSGLQQITPDKHPDVDHYDASYLPDGRIVLCTTAAYVAVPCVYGSDHVANLFLLDRDSGNMRQLCFDQDHNWSPRILPNGRVLYQRWEYSDTPHSNTRMLFHMNPDGTDQREYWGSGVYFPNSFFYARPLPGTSNKVIGVATGHHGTPRSGRLLIVSPGLGRDEAEGVIQEIPGWGRPVSPKVRDRLVDGEWPQFLHPYPISETHFLVSAKMNEQSPWGIYLVDVFDNLLLLAERPGYALLEPVPVRRQTPPPVVPDRVNLASSEASVFMQDVYEGGGLEGVPRGEVAALRVYQYYFGHRGQGGLHGTLGNDSAWDIKRVLGTVPVAPDGSAYFKAPANAALAVQPLDKDGKALQLMRSWFTLQPGEQASCVGCHESQRTAPPTLRAEAFLREPAPIEAAWHAPQRGFSFVREVQPVLDRYCSGCHGDAPPNGMTVSAGREFPYLRGDRWISDWNTQISGGVSPDMGGVFTESYAALQRFLRRPGIESDMRMLSPMDFHFSATELGQLLRKGHHNVELDAESLQRLSTWLDLNAPFHGTWGETHPRQKEHAVEVAARARQLRRDYVPMGPDMDLEYIPELPPYDTAYRAPEPVTTAPGPMPVLEGWPFDSAAAARMQDEASVAFAIDGANGLTLDLGDGITLELTVIPGGAFIMGDEHGHPDERPCAVTEIAPFFMGKFEITNEQFRQFNPDHESRDESRHGYQFGRRGFPMDDPGQPAVRVSWEEAMAFCAWLSERSGAKVTLPTEAQWEWAARAGTDTAFYFGELNADYSPHANVADRKLQEFAQCTARDHYEKAEPITNPSRHDDRIPRCDLFDDGAMISETVGRYHPNPWGLYDMHGNVWEWTRSAHQPYSYADTDGRNDIENSTWERVARGGSWRDRPFRATSSFRLPYRGYQKVFNVGFRVIIESSSSPTEKMIAHNKQN